MEEIKYTVSYANLWKLLIDRRIKKTELKEKVRISPGTYAKLNRDQFVSMDVIARICYVLDCDVEDVLVLMVPDTLCSQWDVFAAGGLVNPLEVIAG